MYFWLTKESKAVQGEFLLPLQEWQSGPKSHSLLQMQEVYQNNTESQPLGPVSSHDSLDIKRSIQSTVSKELKVTYCSPQKDGKLQGAFYQHLPYPECSK